MIRWTEAHDIFLLREVLASSYLKTNQDHEKEKVVKTLLQELSIQLVNLYLKVNHGLKDFSAITQE